MPSKLELEATAYHEAGHAVFAWLCGHRIEYATIKRDPSDGCSGSVQHEKYGDELLFDDISIFDAHPNEPGELVIRTGDTTARPLTQGERYVLELYEDLADLSDPERSVMISASGELAHRKFVPGTFEEYRSASDWENAQEHLWYLAEKQGVDPSEIRANVIDSVNKLLENPWVGCAVKTLSAELLKRETLIDLEIIAVLRSVFVEKNEPCDA